MAHNDLDTLKNEAKRRIRSLVEDYMHVLATGRKEAFNEERVKIAFIVPMLEALGWNPRTDEVLPEQATLTGRADFGLRIGRRTKIFVEMKRFGKRLDGHDTVKGRPRSYAEQAIQYAWGMKADWAVLTNFEETRLYDSHVKKPEDGLVWKKPIRFTEYESRFDELWLISRQSVVSGALDAYKAKIERPPVDKAFLVDLMNCRQLLAEDIKNNNPSLTYDQINESAQKILDRLIFIKNCEDRLIIPAESLWKRYKAWQETAIDKEIVIFMMDLKNLFRYFDQVYNGKLFEKHPCEDLKISNEVLEEILDTLYGDGKHLGYNFSVIPVDVLGQAYELYIGSIIKEKEGHAKAVEIVKKTAKRKAYGIYYTPEPVVDYIVRGTLGKVLEKCKTPEDVSRIKVLDPACGSGSFLIKAFDVIRDWYENYNKQNRPISVRGTLDAHIVPVPNPEERILTENLYGVDLDPQAIEITVLNLSLKAVKTKEKLPYMADHIKCGNSLIDDEKITGDKAFKWGEEFEEIMKEGGFDVVIGNPPYISYYGSDAKKLSDKEKAYFKTYYETVEKENARLNAFWLFIERGTKLLRDGGYLGFIVNKTLLVLPSYKVLRKYLIDNFRIVSIVPELDPFDVVVDATIIFLQKTEKRGNTEFIDYRVLKDTSIESKEIEQNRFLQNLNYELIFKPMTVYSLSKKIENSSTPLKTLFKTSRGVNIGGRARFFLREKLVDEKTHPYLLGSQNVSRYRLSWPSPKKNDRYNFLLFDSNLERELKKKGATIVLGNENRFNEPKLIINEASNVLTGTYDESNYYCSYSFHVINAPSKEDLKYLLGIINSKLMTYYCIKNEILRKGTKATPHLGTKGLDRLPIKVDYNYKYELIKLSDRMLYLNKRLNEIGDKITDERARIEEEIEKTDAEIDELVYKIYGITEAEKKIIEESLK